jgi:hypothetical protein
MKYVLTKNGTYSGEFDNVNEAMLRAQSLHRGTLTFKGDEDYWFAFGPGIRDARDEYEINYVTKRRA